MICGVDEAGRGCLAGPLVVACCTLKKPLEMLNDSKKLTSKKREEIYKILHVKASFMALHFSSEKIDNLGLSYCIKNALLIIKRRFNNCHIIFDGNTSFGVNGIKTIIKADLKVAEASAASIIAKVTRDKIMENFDKIYPDYGFISHKGYGTSLHIERIAKLGLSPIHRGSFKVKSLPKEISFKKSLQH